MPFNVKPGFRGIARIDGSEYFRFSSADVQVKREAQSFLPAYGGVDLKRIWATGTADVAGSISFPLTEGRANYFYTLAKYQQEFYLDLHYFDSQDRRALGCKVDSMQFEVTAGEIVNCNLSLIAKGVESRSRSLSYTKGEKLVTWDKCFVRFLGTVPLDDETMQSFSYNITNGIKTIKTASSLYPRSLPVSIQDVSGRMQFYNFEDLVRPLVSTEANGLGFNETRFVIDDMDVEHDIVFHPTESIPLTPSAVISILPWTRVDDF